MNISVVQSEQFKDSMYSKNIHENYSPLIIQAKATTSGGKKKFICLCMHKMATEKKVLHLLLLF